MKQNLRRWMTFSTQRFRRALHFFARNKRLLTYKIDGFVSEGEQALVFVRFGAPAMRIAGRNLNVCRGPTILLRRLSGLNDTLSEGCSTPQ